MKPHRWSWYVALFCGGLVVVNLYGGQWVLAAINSVTFTANATIAVIKTPKRWCLHAGDGRYCHDFKFRLAAAFGKPSGWVIDRLENDGGHRRDREGHDSGAGGESRAEQTAEPPPVNPSSIGQPGEGEDPELVVPDSAEAIVGYRQWHSEAGWLKSYRTTYWPWKEPLEAEHDREDFNYRRRMVAYGGEVPHYCDAPRVGCSCGIYALKNPDELTGVFGEVSLWGRVVQGSKGYRAQFAYPRKLWVTVPSFKPVETALRCVEEADERVRVEMETKAEAVRTQYAEDYYAARLLADQLADNYGVSVELHDPDQPHPFSPELSMQETAA